MSRGHFGTALYETLCILPMGGADRRLACGGTLAARYHNCACGDAGADLAR